MAISIDGNLFSLSTQDTLYQMQVDEYGILNHLWYGPKTGMNMSYLNQYPEISFSGNLADTGTRRDYSLNDHPLEYAEGGMTDYRTPALRIVHPDGSSALDLRYAGYEVLDHKPGIDHLPASFDRSYQTSTLKITLKDALYPIFVHLYYSAFEKENVIARSVDIENRTDHILSLDKVSSLCLDLPDGDLEVIHFHGRHAMERLKERLPLGFGTFRFESRRGNSSHQHNPAVILAAPHTDESHGSCYGACLLYSGCYQVEVQKDQLEQIRLVMGLEESTFRWKLKPQAIFHSPEALLSYSGQGLEKLSHQFHDLFREHVIRSTFVHRPRPVLINNWEATYFDFNGQKLIEIADSAKECGIDLFVLDDGWFGKRNSDTESLGDWHVNEEKLGMPLADLSKAIHSRQMQFGLWIEPEMVSEDSDLFRTHPDWVLWIPGRYPSRSRHQLVLDLGNPEVVEYLYQTFARLIRDNEIDYIKWDMNRSISDFYSSYLPEQRQGELAHRYMLGVYELADRLTMEFPEVLFEGCAGGGGRFDGGMLYYFPQYWCSDNTDAHCRTQIQYGTSFFYPISSVGSHVSAVPNHQTGRVTSLKTRGTVAMAGTFGYELDLTLLSSEQKDEIRQQVQTYKSLQPLIFDGDYYRLSDPFDHDLAAWSFVSKDGLQILVQSVIYEQKPNVRFPRIQLRGLKRDVWYKQLDTGNVYTGAALIDGGLLLDLPQGTDSSQTLQFVRMDQEETSE